jgi:hypothetical protein
MLSIVIKNKSHLVIINSFGFKKIGFDKIFDFNKFDNKFPLKINLLFERKK